MHRHLWFFLPCLALLMSVPGNELRAAEQTFDSPRINGVALDWCKHWGSECGKPAADLFCSQQGFESASGFALAADIGGPDTPTLVLADGRLCSQSNCDGFKYIQCSRQSKADAYQRAIPLKKSPLHKLPSPRAIPPAAGTRAPDVSNTRVAIPPAMLGGQPELFPCQNNCEFVLRGDLQVNSHDSTQVEAFKTDFSKVRNAQAARFEVSASPFGPAANSNLGDVVLQGVVQNDGVFYVDFIKARENLGFSPGSFYVRVIALDTPKGRQRGAASTALRVYYTDTMPTAESIDIHSDRVLEFTPAPSLQLESFEYSAYRFVENWPPNCKPIPRDTGTHGLEAASKAAGKTWNAATGVFDGVKGAVVDLASTMTFGVVPKSILELALNTAMIAAGIPPEIPDLNKLMSEGAGYFASEMAKVAVSQIPAGELVAATGNLAADITIEMAAAMTEQELRDRLEDEIRKQSKQAIEDAARQAEQAMLANASNTYCRSKSYWPTYTIRLKNTGPATIRDVSLTVSDEAGLFENMAVDFSLDAGDSLDIPILPNPNVRDVQRSQLPGYDESANRAIWWDDDYPNKKTRISLLNSGATTCVDPLGPETYACTTETALLFRTPGRGTLNKNRKFK